MCFGTSRFTSERRHRLTPGALHHCCRASRLLPPHRCRPSSPRVKPDYASEPSPVTGTREALREKIVSQLTNAIPLQLTSPPATNACLPVPRHSPSPARQRTQASTLRPLATAYRFSPPSQPLPTPTRRPRRTLTTQCQV